MRHRKKKTILGREATQRRAMLIGLAQSIILSEKVKTTSAKAKAVKGLVEKSITTAKNQDLASRRRLIAMYPTERAVKKVFDDLAKRYSNRKGGYLRIIKIGVRKGDGAEMVQIELV